MSTITLEQAAAELGMLPRSLYKLERMGRIPRCTPMGQMPQFDYADIAAHSHQRQLSDSDLAYEWHFAKCYGMSDGQAIAFIGDGYNIRHDVVRRRAHKLGLTEKDAA